MARRVRFLWSALMLGAMLSSTAGCFLLAPQPEPGLAEGERCGTDLDCDTGLTCECGTCSSPGDIDLPAACEVDIINECPALASPCYAACGDETEVADAACLDGREVCADGVLRADCPDETCWGEPEPGEICNNGVYECQYAYIPEVDACQTFDCEGQAGVCVSDCASDVEMPQICAGSAWVCEMGFPREQCGPCPGSPPPCFADCVDLELVGVAVCDDVSGWDCELAQPGAQTEEACCTDADGTYQTADDLTAIADEVCLLGTVSMINNVGDVSFPNLRRADSINLWVSNATAFSAPVLNTVTEDFSIWENDGLEAIDVADLDSVGGLFEIANNDVYDQCSAEQILATVQGRGGVGGEVVVSDNAPLADGGVCDIVLPDGGVIDGGLLDGGGDAGPGPDGGADAGTFDGGAPDGGADAGAPDAAGADAGDAG